MKRIGYGLLFVLAWASHIEAQVPFYQGKTLKIVVGYPAGSSHGRPKTIVGSDLPAVGSDRFDEKALGEVVLLA